jgi:hypothetical protein
MDIPFELLLPFCKDDETTTESPSHHNVGSGGYSTFVAFAGSKVNLANTVVFDTGTAYLNHDISEDVDEVGEVRYGEWCCYEQELETSHRYMMTNENRDTRPSYQT